MPITGGRDLLAIDHDPLDIEILTLASLSTASTEDGDADGYPQSIPTVGNNDNAAEATPRAASVRTSALRAADRG